MDKGQSVNYSDQEWQERLEPDVYRVLRQKETERAFEGQYYDHHEEGEYLCAGCSKTLFLSATKFDSGTGWPSFWEIADVEAVDLKEDWSFPLAKRTEVLCKRCGGHLGHLFKDGPEPTKKRYCINSAALKFRGRDTK